MEFIQSLGLTREMLIPIIIFLIIGLIILVLILSQNRKAATSIGLLAATSAVGYYFFKNKKLEEALDIEGELSKKNEKYGDFKNRQKDRYNAVMANQTVIEELKKRLAALKDDPVGNRAEIIVLEQEIREREAMNEKLLSDRENPFSNPAYNDYVPKGDNQFDVYDQDEQGSPDTDPKPPGAAATDIHINGHRLLQA